MDEGQVQGAEGGIGGGGAKGLKEDGPDAQS